MKYQIMNRLKLHIVLFVLLTLTYWSTSDTDSSACYANSYLVSHNRVCYGIC